jgi:hypothetical protein
MLRPRRLISLFNRRLVSGELVNGNRWRAVAYAESVSKHAGGRGARFRLSSVTHVKVVRWGITWANYRQ